MPAMEGVLAAVGALGADWATLVVADAPPPVPAAEEAVAVVPGARLGAMASGDRAPMVAEVIVAAEAGPRGPVEEPEATPRAEEPAGWNEVAAGFILGGRREPATLAQVLAGGCDVRPG